MFIPGNNSGNRADFFSSRSALVTGGAGFIGSHLVESLLRLGCRVTVLDDLSTGLRCNVPDAARFVLGDILNPADVAEAITGADIVFHLAASVSVPYSLERPTGSFRINADGTLSVLEAARQAGASRFILSSSSAVYGDSPISPNSEAHPPAPMSPYAAGKLAAEALVSSFCNSFGLQGASLRYFNVFGPRQRSDSPYAAAIPTFAKRLYEDKPITVFGDGSQTRDFTYVDNVVEANLLAAMGDGKGMPINVASGESITILTLVDQMVRILGRQPAIEFAPPRRGEVMHSAASIDRAKLLLGYEPIVDWRTGLRTSLDTLTARAA
jgi:nucleoside-diphosphate-sugar epimerase